MSPTELQTLLEQYMTESISKADYSRLWATLQQPEYAEQWYALMEGVWNNEQLHPIADPKKMEVLNRLRELRGDISNASPAVPPAHRIHFLKRSWFRYAAAIILIVGGAITAIVVSSSDKQSINSARTLSQKGATSDIPPGGDKAVLTLADGSKIILDNAANGNLAQQGNAAIVKLANGQIAYNLKGLAGNNVMMNTMATPKGGQYQLTLPDGSKVWLNAASSIRFPAAFVGSERKVKITGEVYFEVAKNRQKPFIVDVDDKMDVQVLGTSFNINSYTNEEDIKATLVEGKVRITGDAKSVVLVPGQQARVTNQQLQVVNANIDQTLAWKNGIFNFHNADLKTVMKQLERWYDIKVEYSNPNTSFTFKGKMYRNLNLSEVLEMLSRNGIRFQMEGKKLIVL